MERATGVCTLFFEGLGQNPEVRSQKTEDRGQRTEGERVKRLNSTENVEEAALYLRFVDFMNGMKNRAVGTLTKSIDRIRCFDYALLCKELIL